MDKDNSDSESELGIIAKLRRLKIQENLLLQSIAKQAHGDEYDDFGKCNGLEAKKFTVDLKNSFNELKELFEVIKSNTNCEENIKVLDIDDVKKDIMNLEAKIKTMKHWLQTKLLSLKKSEKELTQQLQLSETSVDKNGVSPLPKQTKPQTKAFKEIVPSPVKNIINSPFKCSDVQKFQEFMMSSPNRYGGWNEYNHNIFINLWQKHFNIEYENIDLEKSEKFDHIFVQEVLKKIAGLTKDDIVSHTKWYMKYLYLKDRQQKALERWRENKRKIKGSASKEQVQIVQKQKNDTNENCLYNWNSNNRKVEDINNHLLNEIERQVICESFQELMNNSQDSITFNEDLKMNAPIQTKNIQKSTNVTFRENPKKKTTSSLLRPTEQWMNRCNTRESMEIVSFENMPKKTVPNWRQGLRGEL